mmetsp:Transcript_3257/g.5408  ORF Transcript_3257/g.5408 Transcript_3257/m.5408 type:complete len:128 (-) Transcript_3257:1054-1437(-)
MTEQLHPKIPPNGKRSVVYELMTYDQVLKNSSQSKYSFSKAHRFSQPQSFGPPVVQYNMPSTKAMRATCFGVGDRFQSPKKSPKNESPSPQKYQIPSLFNPNNTTSTFAVHAKTDKTFAFGAGREAF